MNQVYKFFNFWCFLPVLLFGFVSLRDVRKDRFCSLHRLTKILFFV